MAISLGIHHINVFSDCKVLVFFIKKHERDIFVLIVLHDIFSLANSFAVIFFQFMPRVKNAVADSLAKSALFELQNFHDLEE